MHIVAKLTSQCRTAMRSLL